MSERRYLKVFPSGPNLETDIQNWVDASDAVIVDFKPVNDGVGVLYTRGSSEQGTVQEGPPVPLKEGATAPTISVTRLYAGQRRPAQAMAGIFGVPEGDKLSPEDLDPAPPPLFSPGLDLSKYADLFGNIGL